MLNNINLSTKKNPHLVSGEKIITERNKHFQPKHKDLKDKHKKTKNQAQGFRLNNVINFKHKDLGYTVLFPNVIQSLCFLQIKN
jgi:hypothetical protein